MAGDSARDLLQRLLELPSLSADLRQELTDFQAAAELEPGDQRYIAALGERLLGVARAANDDGPLAADLWDPEDPEVKRWRERAEAAEARVAALEAELQQLKGR